MRKSAIPLRRAVSSPAKAMNIATPSPPRPIPTKLPQRRNGHVLHEFPRFGNVATPSSHPLRPIRNARCLAPDGIPGNVAVWRQMAW